MPPDERHAVLGASSSYRWMACPGSVRLSEGLPKSPPSEHALEGTAAHELAEQCLRDGEDAGAFIGSHPDDSGFLVTQDMAVAVQVYLDYVRSVPGALHIERQFNLDALDPPMPMFGTADAVRWDGGTRTLEVIDYKHGVGVVVYAAGNPQLLYYALGAVLALRVRPEVIRTTVVQPRAHRDEAIDTAEYTWEDLIAFKDELLEASHAAAQDDAPVGPVGDHCRWCPAKAICPAQRSNALEVAQDEFASPTGPPPPSALSQEQLLEVLEKSSLMEDWIKAVREHAYAALERGEEVPGWKLVEGRISRSWADEAEAEEWLRQRYKVGEVFTKKLISPYQAEKLVKDRPRLEIPEDMIAVQPGKPKMVTEDHKKPALTAGTEFDLLTEETQ